MSVASDDSFDSESSIFSSLNDLQEIEKDSHSQEKHSSLPHPAQYHSPRKEEINIEKQQKRSQVFRHHVRLTESQGMYTFSNQPVSLSRKSSLPVDYKSSVATLPYIPADATKPKSDGNMAVVQMIENIGDSSL